MDNGKKGNYWDDYNTTNADSDCVGDTPYVIADKRQDHYPLMSPFDISTVDIELPEWASLLQSPSPSPSHEPDSTSAPFKTALAIALVITITLEGIGLLIYFKKRKR